MRKTVVAWLSTMASLIAAGFKTVEEMDGYFGKGEPRLLLKELNIE